jgi:HK97 family phage major capsid protein
MLDFGYPELLPQLEKDTGIAFAKRVGTAHLLGTNAGEPEGILMNTDITTVNLEETTSITTDDYLKKMYFTLPADFVPNAKWAMLRLTTWELSKMKGGDGHPLLTRLAEKPDFALLGAQIIQAPDMPAVASAAKSVLLADFEELYAVYDYSGASLRIQDPYSSKATGVVEFLTTIYTGGAVLNHQAGIIGVNSVT